MKAIDTILRWETLKTDLDNARIKSKQEFKDFGYVTTATETELNEQLARMQAALIIHDIKEAAEKL